MAICRNCRSSWPDDCKFCGMCGHQTSELADKETLKLAGHVQHLKKVRNRSHPSHLTTVVLSLIVVFIASITVFFTYFNNNNFSPTSSETTLTSYGKAIIGKTLQVVGQHFTSGQTVFVTIDGRPLVKHRSSAYTWHSSAPNLSTVSLSSTNSSGTPVTVRADGTFTIEIHINTHWPVGSTHHLSVENQQGKEIKALNFTVEPDQSLQTPIPTPPTITPPTITPPIPTYTAPAYPAYPTPIPSPTPTSIPSPTPTTTPSPTPSPMHSPTPTPTDTNDIHNYTNSITDR